MLVIVCIALGFFLIISPCFRCALRHPVHLVRYAVSDLYKYIKYHEWDVCHTGELLSYVGLFGKGKTLSVVHRVVGDYARYNGCMVWCRRRKKWVTQRIKVLSNVTLQIPYEQLVSLEQIILCAEKNAEQDELDDTITCTLVLGDEFSVQMNSRNFKTNIDPLFLNTLLTCRHYHISLFYTAQRFGHVDALLRQVTSAVIDCNKLWRFQRQSVYDAWEMENASSPALIKPLARRAWFVRNEDFAAYDTLAVVGQLKKSVDSGDMMTSEQILALQQNNGSSPENIINPSRKLLKIWKKSKK